MTTVFVWAYGDIQTLTGLFMGVKDLAEQSTAKFERLVLAKEARTIFKQLVSVGFSQPKQKPENVGLYLVIP